uniref:Uncharacterized protein n=1 Tax=Corethron hystrix TaxID=216773 RepID=A0A7S1FYV5_9STRA|mmetsp:Transcript_42877/g.100652  ORF Transcript_42877/g.100652 Transcript_42877/m.100652 type:complete len:919 (+) Transcript_42877:2-2758(+)
MKKKTSTKNVDQNNFTKKEMNNKELPKLEKQKLRREERRKKRNNLQTKEIGGKELQKQQKMELRKKMKEEKKNNKNDKMNGHTSFAPTSLHTSPTLPDSLMMQTGSSFVDTDPKKLTKEQKQKLRKQQRIQEMKKKDKYTGLEDDLSAVQTELSSITSFKNPSITLPTDTPSLEIGLKVLSKEEKKELRKQQRRQEKNKNEHEHEANDNVSFVQNKLLTVHPSTNPTALPLEIGLKKLSKEEKQALRKQQRKEGNGTMENDETVNLLAGINDSKELANQKEQGLNVYQQMGVMNSTTTANTPEYLTEKVLPTLAPLLDSIAVSIGSSFADIKKVIKEQKQALRKQERIQERNENDKEPEIETEIENDLSIVKTELSSTSSFANPTALTTGVPTALPTTVPLPDSITIPTGSPFVDIDPTDLTKEQKQEVGKQEIIQEISKDNKETETETETENDLSIVKTELSRTSSFTNPIALPTGIPPALPTIAPLLDSTTIETDSPFFHTGSHKLTKEQKQEVRRQQRIQDITTSLETSLKKISTEEKKKSTTSKTDSKDLEKERKKELKKEQRRGESSIEQSIETSELLTEKMNSQEWKEKSLFDSERVSKTSPKANNERMSRSYIAYTSLSNTSLSGDSFADIATVPTSEPSLEIDSSEKGKTMEWQEKSLTGNEWVIKSSLEKNMEVVNHSSITHTLPPSSLSSFGLVNNDHKETFKTAYHSMEGTDSKERREIGFKKTTNKEQVKLTNHPFIDPSALLGEIFSNEKNIEATISFRNIPSMTPSLSPAKSGGQKYESQLTVVPHTKAPVPMKDLLNVTIHSKQKFYEIENVTTTAYHSECQDDPTFSIMVGKNSKALTCSILSKFVNLGRRVSLCNKTLLVPYGSGKSHVSSFCPVSCGLCPSSDNANFPKNPYTAEPLGAS